ncbi:MAG TPA: hypothetical protein VEU08_22590, partial [Vicinamibacterales bacterium]|nr:hypothetical protein [Vicinamibacterales bacterium]
RVAALTTSGIDRRFAVGPRHSARSAMEWARAFLADAQPYTDALTTAGLPKQVLTDLPGQVDALDKVLADEQVGRKKHVDARQSLGSVMRARAKTMRGLDTIARSVFRTDPDKLAAWKHARRVGPKEKPAAPAPTVPAASTGTETKAS